MKSGKIHISEQVLSPNTDDFPKVEKKPLDYFLYIR